MFGDEVMKFSHSIDQNQKQNDKSKRREKEERSQIAYVKVKEFQERTEQTKEKLIRVQTGKTLCKLKNDLCHHTKKVHETVSKKTEKQCHIET